MLKKLICCSCKQKNDMESRGTSGSRTDSESNSGQDSDHEAAACDNQCSSHGGHLAPLDSLSSDDAPISSSDPIIKADDSSEVLGTINPGFAGETQSEASETGNVLSTADDYARVRDSLQLLSQRGDRPHSVNIPLSRFMISASTQTDTEVTPADATVTDVDGVVGSINDDDEDDVREELARMSRVGVCHVGDEFNCEKVAGSGGNNVERVELRRGSGRRHGTETVYFSAIDVDDETKRASDNVFHQVQSSTGHSAQTSSQDSTPNNVTPNPNTTVDDDQHTVTQTRPGDSHSHKHDLCFYAPTHSELSDLKISPQTTTDRRVLPADFSSRTGSDAEEAVTPEEEQEVTDSGEVVMRNKISSKQSARNETLYYSVSEDSFQAYINKPGLAKSLPAPTSSPDPCDRENHHTVQFPIDAGEIEKSTDRFVAHPHDIKTNEPPSPKCSVKAKTSTDAGVNVSVTVVVQQPPAGVQSFAPMLSVGDKTEMYNASTILQNHGETISGEVMQDESSADEPEVIEADDNEATQVKTIDDCA